MNITLASPPVPLRPDFTFSKGELARRCAFWLRRGIPWVVDGGNACTRGGTVLHHAMASFVTCENGISVVPPAELELRALYLRAKTWLLVHRVHGMRAEIAFAYDVSTDTARELVDPPGEGPRWYADEDLRRKYGVRETEVCTRLDLVCFGADLAGPFLRVWDWKFHFGPSALDAQAQLAFHALVLSRAYGIDRVIASAVHVWEDRVAEEPAGVPLEDGSLKLGPSGVPEFEARDLDELADEVDGIARGAANDPAPTPGAHCAERDCPARAVCPVTARAADEALDLVPADRLVRRRPFGAPLETNEDGAQELLEIDLLEELIAERKRAMRAFADGRGGVRLSNGKVWSGKPKTTETPNLEAPGAIAALERRGADLAIERSTTWAALEAIGVDPDEVREDLRAIDALKISTGPVYMARGSVKKTGAAKAKRRAS